MRILFLTIDVEVTSLFKSLDGHEVQFIENIAELNSKNLENFEMIFLDEAGQIDSLSEPIASIKNSLNIPLVIISSGMSVTAIRNHQRGEFAADAYLVKPLAEQAIIETISDFAEGSEDANMEDENLGEIDLDLDMDLDLDDESSLAFNNVEGMATESISSKENSDEEIDLDLNINLDADGTESAAEIEVVEDLDIKMDDDLGIEIDMEDGFEDDEIDLQISTETGIDVVSANNEISDDDGLDIGEELEDAEAGVDVAVEIQDDYEIGIGDSSDNISMEIGGDLVEEGVTNKTIVMESNEESDFSTNAFGLDLGTETAQVPGEVSEVFPADTNVDASILDKGMGTDTAALTPLEEFKYTETDTVDDELNVTTELEPSDLDVTSTNVSGIGEIHSQPVQEQSVKEMANSMAQHLDQNEMSHIQGTIRDLREERDRFLSKISDLETENRLVDQDNLSLKSELDEVKIELNIIKKRQSSNQDEIRKQLVASEEKKLIYEEKMKRLEKEFDKLNQKVRFDINKVRQRERDLENQLELVKMDAESQIKTRDTKILDLKRKIDALEFNIENASIKEQKALTGKHKMEDKLSKIMQTLKRSMKVIEEDIEIDIDSLSSDVNDED